MSTTEAPKVRTYALVTDGVITNTVVAFGPELFTPHHEHVIELPDLDRPSIGWRWDGQTFTPPDAE